MQKITEENQKKIMALDIRVKLHNYPGLDIIEYLNIRIGKT